MISLLSFVGVRLSLGADAPQKAQPVDTLPEIEARVHQVEVVRSSKSGRIYLLNHLPDAPPEAPSSDISFLKDRKIILLRFEKQPAMAFRVLATYPDKNQIAVRKVKEYPGMDSLPVGRKYNGIEKVQDVFGEPQELLPEDKKDLTELEEASTKNDGEILDYDPELDGGLTNEESEEREEVSDGPDDDNFFDEAELFDPDRNWLTVAEVGLLRNTPPGGDAYYTGLGFRYGYTLARSVHPKKGKMQYSLAAEGGLFYYKVLNINTGGDEYLVLPLIGTLRYTLNFNPTFALFFYGGLMKNSVVSGTETTPETTNALNSTLPAVGVGLNFKLGPGWDLRTELGYELFGIGLTLRY